MGVQRVSTARNLRTTTNWGMSSSPPTKATHDVEVIKLSKRWTATRYIETRGARTEIAEGILEFVDELYEVLVHDFHQRFL